MRFDAFSRSGVDAFPQAFTLSLTRTSLRLAYPQDFVPAAAAPHLLAAAKSFLFPASTTTTIASALNHPPLQTPLDLATRVSTNESAVFAQAGLLLHSAFEACAERFPDRPALDFLEAFPSTHRVFTYRELNKVAEKVAQELRTVYQSQFGIVPVYMSTSAELYISYLAVLKAGLAFSPLPTDAPQHRLEDILGDIGRGIVLGRGKASAVLTGAVSALGYDINYIDVDSVIRRLPAPPLNVPRTSSETSDPNRLAYVLYTSGSTGKPKGVQITHLSSTCSIASNALTRPLSTNPSEPSRWFQFAAPTFDPSIMEIFVTLSMGGTLCSADRELTLTNIEGVVTKLRADIMMTTPSLAVIMNPNQMPTLRSLVVMGEAVIEKVIAGFASDSPTRGIDLGDEKFTGPRGLANGYGPTEAAINVTLFEVFAGYRGSIIGPPTETCSLFILDPNSKEPIPMAYGLAGELAIGGPQVAVGYLNRPEETEKSFVLSEEYGRLYRTGDKARIVWSESGVPMVDFLGRISDEQVKLSGRRVELGEVDAAVGKVHGVAQVATVVYKENPNAQGSEKLVACVVPDEDGFVEEICDETVAELLPEFMQPWKYLVLPSLPWGSSGKLDRKSIKATVELALRNRVHARTVTTTPLAIVGTADPEQVDLLRRLLAGAVGEEWENVSADTNMISLGLDSLRTMMFLQQARASGIEGLTVTDVLKSKSPIAIASLLHLRKNVVVDATEENVSEKWQKTVENYFERNKVSCSESLGVDALEIEKILPTTATQAGMVSSFLQSEASDGKYVYQTIFKINPGADIAKLRQSWDTVLIRHDAFRMCFVTVDDELSPFSQCVLSASSARNRKEWKITRSDSSNEEEFEKAIDGAAKDAAKSIVPQAAWNISLIQSKTQTAIILSMFHGIFDGGSLNLLIEEVAAEYHGLPAPPRTPIDKAVELHYTSDLLGAKDYWKGNLEGYLPEPFPRLTGVKNSYIKGVTDIVNIKSRISINDLLEKSRVLGASPLSALQAAWAIIISSYSDTQSEDVTFGSVLSGRLDKDSEICMGPTFTTVPTRVNTHEISPDGLGTASAMLQHLSKANISALEFLQPPLLSLVTVDGGLPYNTLLAFQMFSAGGEDSDIWSSVYNPPMANDFAVMVEVWPSSDGSLRFKATYKDDFLNSTGAEIMLRQMDDVLIHMFNSPGDVYSVIRSDVSPDLRSSSNPHPKGSAEPEIGCHRLHAQFEEHAERAPDDKALIFKYSLTQDM